MTQADHSSRALDWRSALPFTRIFRSGSRAASAGALAIAWCAVAGLYLTGRAMDAAWVAAGWGALVAPGPTGGSEIRYYALAGSEYRSWCDTLRRASYTAQENAAAAKADNALADQARDVSAWLSDRLGECLGAVSAKSDLDGATRDARRRELRRAVDSIRFTIAGHDVEMFSDAERDAATGLLLDGEPKLDPNVRRERASQIARLIARGESLRTARQSKPIGPAAALVQHEMTCAAAAMQATLAGRWLLGGSAHDAEPSLLGSLRSAGDGFAWLVTQRPIFATLFGLAALFVLGLGGGAICRIAAVKAARDVNLDVRSAVVFIWERLGGIVGAPLLAAAIIVGAGAVMALFSLVGAIPWLGEFLTGMLFFLFLLGGAAMTFGFVALLFGFPLMWPTVAVEGSDSFDAIQSATSYVFQRAASYVLYAIAALVQGSACLVAVRFLAVVLLKFTHTAVAVGMSAFGSVGSTYSASLGKLDAIWSMPAWHELRLMPSLAPGELFCGSFAVAPLSASETLGQWLIAFWVFAVVGLVAAYAFSYFCNAAVEVYVLLRKQVDLVDYDEIFYEEPPDDEAPTQHASPAAPPAAGTSLPIVQPPNS